MGKGTVSSGNHPLFQSKSTNVHNINMLQKKKKETFLTEHLPVATFANKIITK